MPALLHQQAMQTMGQTKKKKTTKTKQKKHTTKKTPKQTTKKTPRPHEKKKKPKPNCSTHICISLLSKLPFTLQNKIATSFMQ